MFDIILGEVSKNKRTEGLRMFWFGKKWKHPDLRQRHFRCMEMSCKVYLNVCALRSSKGLSCCSYEELGVLVREGECNSLSISN